MVYTQADIYIYIYGPKVLEKLKIKLKFWMSFNQKNIYLIRKMQTILNFKALNSRKQIFCSESGSTSFVKINLRKILRKNNFIIFSIIFI